MRSLFSSLRSRLLLTSVLLQCLILGVLVFNANRVWQNKVDELVQLRVSEAGRLLNASLAPTVAAGNWSHATELLNRLTLPDGIDYLVLKDERGRIVAARGWDISHTLPAAAASSVQDDGHLVHARTDLEYGSIPVGMIYYGLSTQMLHDSVVQLSLDTALGLGAGVLITIVLMAFLSFWLTRNLYQILGAVELASSGHFEALPQPDGHDEMAQIVSRFNEMAASIKDRVQALSQDEEKFHAIADYTYSAELWLDPDGKLLWVNASISRLSGYSVNECLMLPDFPLSLAAPEERSRLDDTLRQARIARTSQQDYEFRAIRRDSSQFWAAVSWLPLYDGHNQYLGLRASIRDNSDQKEDRLALRKAVVELRQIQSLGQSYLQRAESERSRMQALLAAMRFGVLFVDIDNRVVFFNPAFRDLWQVDDDSTVIGQPIGQLLQQARNRPMLMDVLTAYLDDAVWLEDRVDLGEIAMNDARVVTQHCHRVVDAQGNTTGRMWIYEDVTQQRQIAERMVSLAERDALTGLYNRHRFQQELERMISETDRRQSSMALVFFDLDEFKHVNDSFGHSVGDELLKTIAREVGKQVRRHEVLSRLGGDEFAVLLPDCGEFEVSRLAERIVQCVTQIQFQAGGHTMRPSTSVGVALYPQHASSSDQLVAHADSAMYQAKAAGKATWRLYRPEADHSHSAITRLSWKERIVDALENDQFELHFQGIYYTESKKLAHLEALLRMKNPEGGYIMPGQFIPHAEKTGKIIDLDRWVISKVIAILAEHPECPSIAVNVSGRSFDEPDLPSFISNLLRQSGVNPNRLLVELTETSAVSDLSDAQRFIDALRNTGCVVCLDDFGVGFASFAYLKQLKADVLKIDGLFIRDLQHDRDSQSFVRGMVNIAHDMGKTTIAEFVENEEIYKMLLDFGVDQVQGYWLDQPQKNHPGLG